MGVFNIWNTSGTNKASLTFTGSSDVTVDSNNLSGLTGNVQTQLGLKAPLANPSFTGTVTAPTLNGNVAQFDTWQNKAGVTYGTILQRVVVPAVNSTTLQTTNMTTIYSATIAPKSANSRIYLTINAQVGKRSSGEMQITCRMLRGSTPITQQLTNIDTSVGIYDVYRIPDAANAAYHGYQTYLGYDQPGVTTPVTYNFQFAQANSGYPAIYFNFSNNSYSSIFLEEIAQ